ncbi:MAG: hypothetical protein IKV49_00220 [Clostridia bacterium]|nr:hypothetical protein [Clostridia bacterium]
MTKTNKIVLGVLAAILVIAVAVTALTGSEAFLQKITGSVDANSAQTLDTLSPVAFGTDYPLVQTEQKNLFYEMNPDGTFKFYKYADGTFSEVSGVKTKDVQLTCSSQKVKVKLHYLSTDAGTVGYGMFNSKQDSTTTNFSYIFVRMMDRPNAYASKIKTPYILLTDMESADAYKSEKTYSDMYSFDMSTGKATLVISQRDRSVQADGTMREDWTIFTDSMLNNNEKYDLFASCRNHDTTAAEQKYDILTVANSKASKKSAATTVSDSPSYVIREKDGAYYCFANTDDGFDLIRNGDKKKPLASFDGVFSDYVVSGNYLLSKNNFKVTDITSGESVSLSKASFTELSGFIANEKGTKFALFCNGEQQSMILYNTDSGETTVITDSIFDNGIRNFCFIDDNTVLFSIYDEAGTTENKTITF